MLKYEYPNYISHIKEHEQFKLHLSQLMKQYEDVNFVWTLPILIFLRDWIKVHILSADKEYGLYLKGEM